MAAVGGCEDLGEGRGMIEIEISGYDMPYLMLSESYTGAERPPVVFDSTAFKWLGENPN